jgi:uncharacterized protein
MFDGVTLARVLGIVFAATMLVVCSSVRAGDVEECRDAATLLKAGSSKAVPSKAVSACRRLAEGKNVDAQYTLGNVYLTGRGAPQNYKEALKWFRKAADQGKADAQSNLGYMYAEGWGVPQDYKEAAKWFRKAAERGNVRAQSNLGALYAVGQGVPEDDREALKWWRKAAEQGNARAQHNVGVMYAAGRGAATDLVQAYMWLQLAAATYPPGADRDAAADNRDDVASAMTAAQIAKAKKMATAWKPKLAQ